MDVRRQHLEEIDKLLTERQLRRIEKAPEYVKRVKKEFHNKLNFQCDDEIEELTKTRTRLQTRREQHKGTLADLANCLTQGDSILVRPDIKVSTPFEEAVFEDMVCLFILVFFLFPDF